MPSKTSYVVACRAVPLRNPWEAGKDPKGGTQTAARMSGMRTKGL
jgi:hypothetical protein